MKVIALEGGDRVGKKTQSNLLAERLRKLGKRVAVVEVPYRDFITYRLIYGMLKDGTAFKHPNLFQLLQFANKLIFQLYVLPFIWFKNDYLIFDRWCLSSVVYGSAAGADVKLCETLARLLVRPDTTLVLAANRPIKAAEDVFEANVELQRTVVELYETYCNGEDVIKIDASRSIDSTHQEIWMCLAWCDVSGKM